MTPTGLDHLLILFLALLPLMAGPAIHAFGGSSKPARYTSMMLVLTVLGVCVAAVWTVTGRPFEDLGLVVFTTPGFLAASGLAVAFVVYVVVSIRRLGEAERATTARSRLRSLAGLLPRTRRELIWFICLGLVAGLTEELMYRGYLLLGLTPGGPWAALAVSTLIFGIAHLYQGPGGAAGTALFGLGLGLVTLLAGSIIPAILIHSTQDLGTGVISYRLAQTSIGAG